MKRILLLLLTFALFALVASSQNTPTKEADKNDVVLLLNGDEKIGTVTEVNQDGIKFMHKGESVSYTFKRSEIFKITFSSGRIEFFNKLAPVSDSSNKTIQDNSSVNPGIEHHNKVAILPFGFIVDEQSGSSEMVYKIQNECYNMLSKKSISLQIQDPTTTNALLIKGGVTPENFRGFTLGEICNVLAVEYVIQGTVTLNKTSATSVSSGTYSAEQKDKTDKNKNVIGQIFTSGGSQYSTSYQNYATSITMNVFDDKGTKLFGQDHQSVWNTLDAYKITLQYLLKRTPVYGR